MPKRAQDGFVKAYRNLGRFRQGAPFRPWLLAIVGNEARNRRVAAGRRERLALRVGEERPDAVARAAEGEALAAGDRPTTLAAARHGLVFEPLLPSGLEGPNGVFLDPSILGGALNLTYPPQPDLPRSRLTGVGLLVDELEGQAAPGFYGKMVPPGARIERFRLDRQFAVWIEGLHAFVYKPHADFTFHIGHSRLAANALLVQHGAVMVRLEGKLDKATALAIARTLHR